MGFSTKADDAEDYLREAFGDAEDRVPRDTTEASHGTKTPRPGLRLHDICDGARGRR
jgi:hypothetical protein